MAFNSTILKVLEARPNELVTLCRILGSFECSGGNCAGSIFLPKRYANKRLSFLKFSHDHIDHFGSKFEVIEGEGPRIEITVPANSNSKFEIYFELMGGDWQEVQF